MRTCSIQSPLRIRSLQALAATLFCGALVTLSGCIADGADAVAAVAQPVAPVAVAPGQPVAHEMHRMFEAEKRNAPRAQAIAQF
jgi:hypothetical protein